MAERLSGGRGHQRTASAASITGGAYGVDSLVSAATVVNSGTIAAATGTGVVLHAGGARSCSGRIIHNTADQSSFEIPDGIKLLLHIIPLSAFSDPFEP
jgi:hypothetical protein